MKPKNCIACEGVIAWCDDEPFAIQDAMQVYCRQCAYDILDEKYPRNSYRRITGSCNPCRRDGRVIRGTASFS